MSDAEEIARIVAEQRATPADLKPQATPAPESDGGQIAPEPEVLAVEAETDTPPESSETPETPVEAKPDEPAPKKKKSATDYLTGRVGNLQQKLNQEQADRAALQARLEAAEALLNARGTPAPEPGATPPQTAPARTDINPNTARVYTPEEFQAAVAQQAATDALNAKANAVYASGVEAFPDFQDTVATLGALGIMTQDFVEAAIEAAGNEKTSAAMLHALSADPEEATRIASLRPALMGAALAKLANQVAAPAQARVSAAPPPISGIRGAVTPVIDLAKAAENDSNDMSAFIAARIKQGDPYARPPGRRH